MQNYRILHILMGLAAIVIITAGMKSASTLLVPFLLAGFISILCTAPMSWLTAHRVPVWLAVALIVLTLLGVFISAGYLVNASTLELRDNIPVYRDQFQLILEDAIARLESIGIKLDPNLLVYLEPSAAFSWLATVFASLRDLLVNFVLIIFIVAFALLEAHTLPAKIEHAFGNKGVLKYTNLFSDNIKKYIVIKAWVSFATGVLVGLMTWAIGLDYPWLWGLLAFFLNFVPNIGSIIATVPAAIIALVSGGWYLLLQTVVVFLLVNISMGNVVEPRVMGAHIGLSPLVVFSSLIIWGWVFGPVGILLAVPLTMVLQVALDSHPETRWLAVVLGNEARD